MCDYNTESRGAAPEIHFSESDETAVYHATEIRNSGLPLKIGGPWCIWPMMTGVWKLC